MALFSGWQDTIKEKLVPLAARVGEEAHIDAMKAGLMAVTPLTILGGVALIVAQPPVDAKMMEGTNWFTALLVSWKTWAAAHANVLMLPYQMSMGVLGLFTVIGVAYFMSRKYKMNELSGVITALLTFFCVTATVETVNKAPYMNMNYLDAKGMFLGIIIAMGTIEITRMLDKKGLKITMPPSVPSMVAAPFEALISLFINVFFFMSLNEVSLSLWNLNLAQLTMKIFSPVVSASDSAWGILLIMFLLNGLWFFGIHGGATIGGVTMPFFMANFAENAQALANGQELPHILAGGYWIFFANFGGSGAALALIIAAYIVGKSEHMKSVFKIGIIPVIFNVSEPILFSLPMILNLFLFIPMVFIPMLNGLISYYAFDLNLVGRIYINAPMTTPGPFAAFLSTMDWRAVVLWFGLLVLSVVLYIPFLRAYDKVLLKQEEGENSKCD
ncbi:PTS sugar transporter subunit IIC [Anaerosinus massiliensis]|uniref:PTS sugar transporter subunit IIC n=1 Tax=Massilibacillus massiliensis TaxID=1806837 RepID=UPI000DA61DEA|nr:PTS transporter subunit EIIC [Massilibacillus massiliensis]